MTRMVAMTLDAVGFGGAPDARMSVGRAMSALRRASGFAIFASGLVVLVVHAIERLQGA